MLSTSEKHPTILESALLAGLDETRIPEHVAIVLDGNRRWARKHASKAKEGHLKGADNIIEIVKAAQELGIKTLTLYAFSTENWNRPREEVDALMGIFATYLYQQRAHMVETGIHLATIGDLNRFPPLLQQIIHDSKVATQHCNKINLVLALNYGSRNELCRVFKSILADCEKGILHKDDISEATIASYLDTAPWKDPELLIRPGGELRVSNFLLWQISYSEIYVTSALWPEFTPQHLVEALMDYQRRQRRWGGD